MKRPARAVSTPRPAATIAERHIELIMRAFDAWERRVNGSPSWLAS